MGIFTRELGAYPFFERRVLLGLEFDAARATPSRTSSDVRFGGRDSNNNPLKRLLLSPHERELFASGRFMANPNGSGNVVYVKVMSARAGVEFWQRLREGKGKLV